MAYIMETLLLTIMFSEVLQRFPNISMLDMQPVGNAPPPQQGISPSSSTGFAPTNISTPPQPRVGLPMGSPQVQGSFYDGENSRQATEDFLTKYVHLEYFISTAFSKPCGL